MRKEPPLTAPKSAELNQDEPAVQHLEDDVFAASEDEKAQIIDEAPNDEEEPTPPKTSTWPMTRIQIEVLIENGKLATALPDTFDARVKSELPSLLAKQQEKDALEKANDLKTGLAALIAAVGFGWLGYQLSDGHIWISIGLTIFGFFCGSMVMTQMTQDKMPADNFDDLFPNAVTEQRILEAVKNLNSESKILRRAMKDGYIKQAWIDNMKARRRIENDIAKARQQLDYYSRRDASERREGQAVSASTASLLADAQARLSIATAELTGSQAWTYPNITKCKDRYSIDRLGQLKKDR